MTNDFDDVGDFPETTPNTVRAAPEVTIERAKKDLLKTVMILSERLRTTSKGLSPAGGASIQAVADAYARLAGTQRG